MAPHTSPASADTDWGTPRSRDVTWYSPATLTAAAAELSGRQMLEAISEGRLPAPPMAELSAYNPIGMIHGGLLCTLLDFAAGAAVHTQLPAGVSFSSIEIKVSYLKTLRANSGDIDVHGRALQIGRRVAFAEAHARNPAGELVGHATSSIAVIGA